MRTLSTIARTDAAAAANRKGRALRAAVRAIRFARKRSEGSVMVEFGLVLPVFLLMVFGVFESGRLFWTQSTLQFAVQEAARCASVNATTCGSTSAIKDYAASKASEIGVAASSFTVTSVTCGNKVQIDWPFSFGTGDIFPYSTITLSAESCYPK